MKWLKKYWLLILIASLALFLRANKLGQVPPELTWDEPALGYNAYSILKTARDEYGRFLPMSFKSFGDDKPGLFIYFMVPFVAIFGLTRFAIRFPSALVGAGSVIAIFFLTLQIIGGKKKNLVPYLAAILLAISPWNIQFSRGAWEANFALFNVILFTLFFLRFLEEEKKKYLIFSVLFWAVSVGSYHGAKVFLVCFTIALVAIVWKELKKMPSNLQRISFFLAILLLIPLLASFKGSAHRGKVTMLFSYKRPLQEVVDIFSQENTYNENIRLAEFFIFHSEAINTLKGIAERYFNHFTGRFLFFEGDWSSPRHSMPYMGMMYLVELPLLVWGIARVLKDKNYRYQGLLFVWLFAGPIPAAVTRDIIHGLRSYWMVVPLIIFTAEGVRGFLEWAKSFGKIFGFLGSGLLISTYLFFFVSYLDIYYVHFSKLNSVGWNYGMHQVAEIVESEKPKYNRIVVTQKYGQPYIYYLFYSRYDPRQYQPQAFLKEDPQGDVGQVDKIDNINFASIYWPTARYQKKTLYIGTPEELPLGDIDPKESRVIGEINYLDGRVAFRVVETL